MKAIGGAAIVAALLLVLTGCANGKLLYLDAINDFKSVTGFGDDGAADQTEPPPLTSTEPGPPLIVGFKEIRVAIPYAGKSGTSDAYVAPDGVVIAMHSGMVSRVTGLGIDMHGSYLAAGSPWLGNIAQAARDGVQDNRVIEYWEKLELKRDKFRCSLTITDRDGGGSIVDETCKRFFEPYSFVNRYWIDAEDRIECSRQWIHPQLSPLQFFRTTQQAVDLDLTENGC